MHRAGIERLVDVRTAPGSRRHPHVARARLEGWLPDAGVAYRWDARLGGFRRPAPDSPNTGLENPSFRGYADHMASADFRSALERLAAEAREQRVCVMCSEALWWRCHRRLIADAAVLLEGLPVEHLDHRGMSSPHRPTPGVRVDAQRLVYADATGQLELS